MSSPPSPTQLCAALLSASMFIAPLVSAQSAVHELIDAVHESPAHLGLTQNDGVVKSTAARGLHLLNFTDRKVGDFSLETQVEKTPMRVGLTPGPFIASWNLTEQDRVQLWSRVANVDADLVEFHLIDEHGAKASHPSFVIPTDGQWHHIEALLSEFEPRGSFDLGAVVAIQTADILPVGARLAFDGACFTSLSDSEAPLGITDMTYAQRMAEAEQTRAARANAGFRRIADFVPQKPTGHLFNRYANLWLGEEVEEVNAELLAIFGADPESDLGRRHEIHRDWSLWLTPFMVRTYDQFGSTSKRMPGRLYPDTEKALLELLWRRTQATNDISLARRSTWWMIGSENHDIHVKVDSLLSSQIFKNHPDFKDRVYTNAGQGGGMGYWFHHQHGDSIYKGPQGHANWSDGKAYTAQDHYEAWTAFWKDYLRERVKKGFFLEVASQGYMKFTVSSLHDLYDHAEDEELRQLAKDFLDLVWAEWAQDQLVSVRGGAKTRWYDRPYGAMFRASGFHSGNVSGDSRFWYPLYASEYRWPEYVWRMALDRQGKGEFVYISRKPGEEPLLDGPRPAGLERTLMCDTDSRLVRYSWVTPDYILGTQMDHPNAIHSHLSSQNRWQGITFAASHTTTVAPVAINLDNPDKWLQAGRASAPMYRSVQQGNVLITQQARRWHQQNPDWYPAKVNSDKPYGVSFKGHFDAVDEQDGWVFTKVGDAYVGVRPVKGAYDYDSNWTQAGESSLYAKMSNEIYEWGPNRRFIRFFDNFSPVIMHTGRSETHGDFEAFKQHLLAGQVRLLNTVVPGWHILLYEPEGETPRRFEFNAANASIPSVNGQLIEYAPDAVFKSPFLNAEYDSGVVHVTVDGIEETVDFRAAGISTRDE